MNITELEILVKTANNNEDVIKNKTIPLRNEIRDWCIEELRKIEAEEKKLLDFVNENQSMFCDSCGTPLFYSFGLVLTRRMGHCRYYEFTKLMLDMNKVKYDGYDSCFQTVSVHNWTTKVQGCYDCMNGDIEYWTRMKKCVDFRRYQLEGMTKNLGRMVQSVLDGQKKRMDGIVKVCNEIDNERNESEQTIEVTISIHKTR